MNNVLPASSTASPKTRRGAPRSRLKRYGRVGEIAKTVACLLSDGAGYITGQNIRVDGGVTRSV